MSFQFTPRRRFLLPFVILTSLAVAASPQTERQFLSGHGPRDAVSWDFTVTGGRRAGEKTTIPVPSNWELQGFGTYNYGQQKTKSSEHGLYQTRFSVPARWKGRRIWLVFEGVMTDAAVTLNGRSIGPVHQGGFYRFRYDVTSLLKFGAEDARPNQLDVDVAKVSANPDTERAERGGDYWVFGGIYRPVWLEATPLQAIDHVAIDARADGAITADVTLAGVRDADRVIAEVLGSNGRTVSQFAADIPRGGTGRVRLTGRAESPSLWTAETPALYTLRLTLRRGEEPLHAVDQRFGFRTFEVRPGQGLFVNGRRVLLRGVDRHSFRPETGRALNPEDCYADARLIREMNMNAVRMSHYPPDAAFLDACDELGIYVLDELSGWHHAHDTANGRILVRAMVERDVNHPSILFWDNGNEGGWNRDLDGDFALYDPQHRPVLHPWELHDGVNTKHYPNYDDFVTLLRGRDIVMPTEFLHSMYDGGGGAGLADYWRAIAESPVGGGGFIWDFADEGVVRTDQNGRIDVFSTFAPDGIVGPHFEREGSFYAIRALWSPVQIDPPQLDAGFTGALTVRNAYDFTSLSDCRFSWELRRITPASGDMARATTVVARGDMVSPAVAPHEVGTLTVPLPPNWKAADVLAVTALSPAGEPLWTWTWPTPSSAARLAARTAGEGRGAPTVEANGAVITMTMAYVTVAIDAQTGMLRAFEQGGRSAALTAGPRLAFARAGVAAEPRWLPFAEPGNGAGVRRVTTRGPANLIELEVDDLHGADAVAGLTLEISPDGNTWHTVFDATRRPQDGARYEFPPQTVAAVRLTNLRRFDGVTPVLKTFRLGFAAERFPVTDAAAAVVTSGTGRDAATGLPIAWVEARGGPSGLDDVRWELGADGVLQVKYQYSLNGAFTYHGVTFDLPENQLAAFRWIGAGPYRVWQNRTAGTTFGIHQHVRHTVQPGESWDYPEFEGYFDDFRWARFDSQPLPFAITSASPGLVLRVGTPRISAATTTVDFPPGEISIVHAFPAIGSKGKPPERAGPASQPAQAHGTYSGTLLLSVNPTRE